MDNQIPRFGGQGSQDQPSYAPDQWPYQLQSSIDPLECPQSEQVNYVRGAQVYREDVEIVQPPTTRKGKEKKVSRRGGGFTKEEDGVLCSAFLNVSKDAITGYYKRLHDYYNTFKPEGSNRSQLAIQYRWGTIQRSVNKFCGFKSAVDRLHESGKNEQDRIDDAVRMYEAVEPFQFMHCWKILRNESKWNDNVLELNSNSAGTGGKVLHKQTQLLLQWQMKVMRIAFLLDQQEEIVLKERVADASSSSTAVDVLQRIHDNREKCQQKEDEQMVQILTRKDEKLSLQREYLDLKKQQRDDNLCVNSTL
ncbi:hypothetical protein PVAP13_9NG659533 [Panicum virgatum]|uniref:No apical meristem-associated C-terminal domain-containing protein n=1 Tax=Panicum virgatum TaxID=38727 RepID=A0A8T0N3T0_PANVG|nr:hypothetical protein PVAP13_9NG659533 [Panicum virgatum]